MSPHVVLTRSRIVVNSTDFIVGISADVLLHVILDILAGTTLRAQPHGIMCKVGGLFGIASDLGLEERAHNFHVFESITKETPVSRSTLVHPDAATWPYGIKCYLLTYIGPSY